MTTAEQLPQNVKVGAQVDRTGQIWTVVEAQEIGDRWAFIFETPNPVDGSPVRIIRSYRADERLDVVVAP